MAKTTVALTPRAHAAAERLDRFELPEMADRVRLGFAYAIAQSFDINRAGDFGVPGGAGNYTASTATLDPDNRISRLVGALFDDIEEPYLAVETLANKGIIAIDEDITSGAVLDLSDLLESGPVA